MTRLLRAYAQGKDEALEEVFALVYDDLKQIARNHLLREREGHTLNPTALVHESYLNLAGGTSLPVKSRSHFFAVASRVMRHILVDHARSRRARKRGGSRVRVPLEPELVAASQPDLDMIALHEALERLGERSERLERVVECKVFGGMTTRETSEVVGVAVRTVEKDWTLAKAFLHRELRPGDAGNGR